MSQISAEGIDTSVVKRWKRYPAYKDSGVEWLGKVPRHWEALQLRRRWRVIDCKHRTAEYVDDGIPIVSTTEVKPGRLNLENTRMTSEAEFLDLTEGRLPKRGDIIYSRNASVGSAAYVDTEKPFGMGQDVCLITSTDQNQLFLSYLLNSPVVLGQLEALMVGSTIHRINVGQIQRFWLVCPPLEEQYAIASFLDRETAIIDALISKKERLIELLLEKRTAIISHAVTKGLYPTVPVEDSRVEWLGKIPAHWQVKRIRAITESIQTGPFGSQLHSEEYVSGGIPVINPSHLKDGRIEPDWDCAVDKPTWQRLSRHELREGDIIFARRGEMGRCALVTAAEAGWLCGTGSLRMRLKLDIAYPQFLNWILSTSGVRDWLLLESVGATMDNLNTTILARVPLSVPPFDEQVAIASYLDRETAKIDALIAKIREGIKKLKEYRTALISAAVTGKISVQ